METSNMKNMVVLKNLPSNLVEEAIIILKSNKKVKKLEKIDKKNKLNKEPPAKKEKDYILKEAEKEIVIIDGYADFNESEIISKLQVNVTLIIKTKSKLFKEEIKKYNHNITI